MSKIIVGLVVAALVAGGAYYFISNKGSGDAMVPSNTDTSAPAGKKMAFSEFIKQGGSYKCTVNQSVGGVTSQGITYISGDMIRGEYKTNVQGMDVSSMMIVRDGYTYSWTSMMPNTGFKVKVAANATGDTSAAASGQYSFNAEQIGDYNCEAWTADASMFTVPTDVKFQEIGA